MLDPFTAVASATSRAVDLEARRLVAATAMQIDLPARRLVVPVRFIAVVTTLVGFALVPIHPTPHAARVASIVALGLFILATLSAAVSSKQVLTILGVGDEPQGAPVAIGVFGRRVEMRFELASGLSWPQMVATLVLFLLLRGLQRIGTSLLAASFFVFWMAVYLLLWSIHPQACSPDLTTTCGGAFRGVGHSPSIGMFLYYAVGASVASNPPDVIAHSPLVRAALIAEVVTALGALGTAVRFVGWPETRSSEAVNAVDEHRDAARPEGAAPRDRQAPP